MMLSPQNRKRVMMGALFGAVSGAVLAAVLYFAADPNPFYVMFVPVAAAVGAGQMYVTREE